MDAKALAPARLDAIGAFWNELLKTGKELTFQRFVREEPATSTGVNRSQRRLHITETLLRYILVLATYFI